MEYYVGIDIGTSSTKFILVDDENKVCGQCVRNYKYTQPQPGYKEIDPKIWIEAVDSGIEELLEGINKDLVKVIGITGQMHTTLFIDENGKSIRPAIMWNDIRTKEEVEFLKENLIENDTTFIKKIISTGSPAVNIYWLKKYELENFNKMKKFLIGPDFITYYFTGKYTTDYCEASTSSLLDIQSKTWSKTMKDLIGLDECCYPEIKGSSQVAGVIKKEVATKFGLNKNTKIVVGTGDNSAAAISSGCIQNKYPLLSLGTSGVLIINREKLYENNKGKNILFSIDGKEVNILVQGVVQSCGSSYSWLVNEILKSKDFDSETKGVDIDKLGENDLIFYPHLVGDKTIYADSTIRGAFVGLSTDLGRSDLIIAVMEGICFAIKELISAMNISKDDIKNLKVTGGGAKNKIWMQMLADVLDISISQLDSSEGAAYGMALLAKYGVCDLKENVNVDVLESFYPKDYNVKVYNKKYKKYLKIYKAMKSIYE